MHGALLKEACELQGAVALWNSATYDEGMVRLRTLNTSLSESSRNLEALYKPMTTLLEKAKKKGLVATASKRAARWSLAKHLEAHGLGKNWLNFLIELKIVSEFVLVAAMLYQPLPLPYIAELSCLPYEPILPPAMFFLLCS